MTFTEMKKYIDSIENVQPNPQDYEDTPEGDAKFCDDYWQGDIEAMLYHDDMGDR